MLFWGTGAWISANASNTFPCQFHSLCLLHFQEEKLPLEYLAFCTLREISIFAELMGCGDIPVTLRKLLIYLEATEQDDRQGAWNTWILVRHLLICSNAQFRRKLASTSLHLPPPKLSRRGNLIWILCQLLSAGQYLLHVQCIGNDTTHGFGFQDGREIFHGYYLTLVPVSRRVKASELQWWSWELQWMCMRNILWRGFLRCVEVWSWKRKYYCLNCRGEWKRKVGQGDGRSGEFPRWVHCLRKYPALICLGMDFPADLFDSP